MAITTIKYFDCCSKMIVIEYDTGLNLLKPAAYRDSEIEAWLAEHSIEQWIDPIDYQNLIRGVRDNLIGTTDWTQLPDVPLTTEEKAAWATYRQDLRDFPNEHTDVTTKEEYDALTWPTPPA